MVRLFAGSLVRFYAADQDPAAGERIRAGIRHWREDLDAALAGHLAEPLAFDEDSQDAFDVTLPDVVVDAARLLAAYAEQSDLVWPDAMPEDLRLDPAWQRTSASDFRATRFPQIVIPEFWLPGDFAFTARQSMPDGNELILGSLDGLCDQLQVLNQETVRLGRERCEALAEAQPPEDAGFLPLAEYGIAVWIVWATRAQQLRAPAIRCASRA